MDAPLTDLIAGLERFRMVVSQSGYDRAAARRRLATLRLELLRRRRRDVAMVLSEGVRGGVHLPQAIDDALAALRLELRLATDRHSHAA